jgi:hypothetical protein
VILLAKNRRGGPVKRVATWFLCGPKKLATFQRPPCDRLLFAGFSVQKLASL